MSTDPNNQQAQPPAPSPSAPNMAEEKARLECEKLKAEIENLRKPPHRSTAFYSAVLPILLAAVGGFLSWSSGWFDVQRTRVVNEKTLVEAQTERLKAERLTLEREAMDQRARVVAIEEEVRGLKDQQSILTNQIVRLERERDEMRSAKAFFESEARRLAGSDTNAMRLFTELQGAQASREKLVLEIQGLQSTNQLLWESISNETAVLRQAAAVIHKATSIALSDVAIWRKFQEYIQDSLRVGLAIDAYLPEWQVEADPGIPPGTHLSRPPRLKSYDDYMREAGVRSTNKPTGDLTPGD